jgi:outer membrane murein-binding lipoprotein Lpp
LRRRKTRTRQLELGAAALAALCLSGCGGDAKRTSPPPTLPRALASSLAARSDAVADALAAGDSCRALTLAQQLRGDTIAAITAGRVDARLQEELTSAVNDLAERVECVPPPTQPQDEGENGKHKGKGHKKKHKGDD